MPTPAPADVITPSILCGLMRNAYRLHRLRYRTFHYLLRSHSISYLISKINPHYQSFVKTIDLSLCTHGVDADFDAVRRSCHPFDDKTRKHLLTWTRERKSSRTAPIIDLLVFRTASETAPWEPDRSGLVFPGIRDGALSAENIRDIALYIHTLNMEDSPPPSTDQVNGESPSKRSVSLPGFNPPSWDGVVQTSSSFLSALSFGTLPAKRSPLVAQEAPEPPKLDVSDAPVKGRWIVGGDTREAKRIWLEEGGDRVVPISLGNARPANVSGAQTPGEDNLVQVDLSVYKVNKIPVITNINISLMNIFSLS